MVNWKLITETVQKRKINCANSYQFIMYQKSFIIWLMNWFQSLFFQLINFVISIQLDDFSIRFWHFISNITVKWIHNTHVHIHMCELSLLSNIYIYKWDCGRLDDMIMNSIYNISGIYCWILAGYDIWHMIIKFQLGSFFNRMKHESKPFIIVSLSLIFMYIQKSIFRAGHRD